MSGSTAYTPVPLGISHGEPFHLDDTRLDGISRGDHKAPYLTTRDERVERYSTSTPLSPVDNHDGSEFSRLRFPLVALHG